MKIDLWCSTTRCMHALWSNVSSVCTRKHFSFCKSWCDNYVHMQSHCAIFDRSNVIHPSPRTREHKASIGNREMSLTMCGCFQLTSEACYKYSDAAHCAPLLSGTQTDAITNPDSTWIYTVQYFPEPHACVCMPVMEAGLHYRMNNDSVSVSYNYNLCYCCSCWEEFLTCQPYFWRRDYCVLEPCWQTEWQICIETIAPTLSWAQTKSPWWWEHTSLLFE